MQVGMPSNVDMAKMKSEWLSKYWRDNPVPFRTRFFAHMPRLMRLLNGRGARLVNWMNRRSLVRAAMKGTVGISAEREMPAFADEPVAVWFRKQIWRREDRKSV